MDLSDGLADGRAADGRRQRRRRDDRRRRCCRSIRRRARSSKRAARTRSLEALTGGDDYELLLAVRPRAHRRFAAGDAARRRAVLTRIGRCTEAGAHHAAVGRGVERAPAAARATATFDDSRSRKRAESGGGWTRCCTSPTRRSARRRRSRSASFFGFSPFLGCTRCSAIIVAFLFNLNRVAALLGVYSNLPWIIAPYYAFATMAGATITRTTRPPKGSSAQLVALFEMSALTRRILAPADHNLETAALAVHCWLASWRDRDARRNCLSAGAGIRDKSPPHS